MEKKLIDMVDDGNGGYYKRYQLCNGGNCEIVREKITKQEYDIWLKNKYGPKN